MIDDTDERWSWFVFSSNVEGIRVPDGLRETLESEKHLPHEERMARAKERALSGYWKDK